MSLLVDDVDGLANAIRDSMEANATSTQKPRWHLGMSIIGKECARQTWYSYRWFTLRTFKPHQTRIFAFGHLIEPMLIGMLKSAGIEVQAVDPSTGKQFLYSAVHGHYGGSCDGVIAANVIGPWRVIVECKSYNAAQFSAVVRDGVKVAKPQYYAQMCGYGKAFDAPYSLHLGFGKNDSDITVKLVENDFGLAVENERKAEELILARIPPPKITNKATDHRCKLCDHWSVCHQGAPPVKSCRSCEHGYPTENAQWLCAVRQQIIPREVAYVGCDQHKSLV